jgi:hypothetical protein
MRSHDCATPGAFCLWHRQAVTRALAATRRPMVEGLTPVPASSVRKAATDSGVAGNAFNPRASHHDRKMAKSLSVVGPDAFHTCWTRTGHFPQSGRPNQRRPACINRRARSDLRRLRHRRGSRHLADVGPQSSDGIPTCKANPMLPP